MKNNTKQDFITAAILAAAALGLALLSWLILPDVVISQVGFSGDVKETVSKSLAVFIPMGLTLFCDFLFLISTGSAKRRNMYISIVGIALVAVIYVFNFVM